MLATLPNLISADTTRSRFRKSRGASNVNQICHRINSTCHVYEDDVAELKARQAEIWELLKVRQRDEL